MTYCWSMIRSDLPSPAEALSQTDGPSQGFAQAGNRYPLFGIMRWLFVVGALTKIDEKHFKR